MKRIIAIDLDGTLLDDNLNISDKNLDLINLAYQNRYEIVICTGRPLESVRKFISKINKKRNIVRYMVLLNGSSIYDLKNNINLRSCFINKNIIRKAVNFIIENKLENINLVAMNDYEFLTRMQGNIIDELKVDAKKNKMKIIKLEDNELINKKNINKIFYIGLSQILDKFQNEFELYFGNSVETVRSSSLIFEILPIDVNKGKGLKWLSDKIGAEKKDIICIGDELNDISMFDISGKNIAMINGNYKLKEKADFITDSNNKSGVAKAIEWILGLYN